MTGGRLPLLIVGASGRAAAASARRAGFEPYVIDLFADVDTRRLAPTLRCPPDRYPGAIPGLADEHPPGPFIYTGGLENHPDCVGALTRRRRLFGVAPDVLRPIREPHWLATALSGRFKSLPETIKPTGCHPPDPGRIWLRKPDRGAGGRGVRFARPEDWAPADQPCDYHLQEFIPGDSYSALFLSPRAGTSRCFAVLRQLVGEPWLHAPPFGYSGNIGPLPIIDTFRPQLERLAASVGASQGLIGVWGIDFILNGNDVYPVDLNPRYTASVELYEYGRDVSLLARHCEVFGETSGGNHVHGSQSNRDLVIGKAVYYAPHAIVFPASGPWDDSISHCTEIWNRPEFADIPDPGTVTETGHPVLSILTDGRTEDDCLERLKSRAAALDQFFG